MFVLSWVQEPIGPHLQSYEVIIFSRWVVWFEVRLWPSEVPSNNAEDGGDKDLMKESEGVVDFGGHDEDDGHIIVASKPSWFLPKWW